MFKKEWFWIKTVLKVIWNFYSFTPIPTHYFTSRTKLLVEIVNDKIKIFTNGEGKKINTSFYEKYFLFLEKLGLKENFNLTTIQDKLLISGIRIKPILINENNKKIIVFCHGVTNDKWSLFYAMFLSLRQGYQVVSYDFRHHGDSSKFSVTLGQVEACDLQDVINFAKKRYQPRKIGLYGFSMGASTCLFWISYFGSFHNNKISFVVCDSPFDYFSKQYEKFLGEGINRYWKKILLERIIKEKLNTSYEELKKINPFLVLPKILPVNLLLLHGLDDVIIDWKSSCDIYRQLTKDESNKKKVKIFFFEHANHGEIPFVGDYIPNTIKEGIYKKKTSLRFKDLLHDYLRKNF